MCVAVCVGVRYVGVVCRHMCRCVYMYVYICRCVCGTPDFIDSCITIFRFSILIHVCVCVFLHLQPLSHDIM